MVYDMRKALSPRVWKLARAGSGAPDGVEVAARADTVGAAIRHSGSASFVAVHSPGRGIEHYVSSTSAKDPIRIVGNLDSVVSSTHVDAQPPDLLTPVVMCLQARPSESAARETQVGGDPSVVSSYLGRSLPEGAWVGVSMRAPSRSETSNVRRWFDHRLGSSAAHYSRKNSGVIASFWAGAASQQECSSLLSGVAAALPGFDLEVHAKAPLGSKVPAAVSALVAVLVGLLVHGVPGIWAGVAPGQVGAALAAAVLPLLVAAGFWTGRLPTPASRVGAGLAAGMLPVPSRRLGFVSPPTKEREVDGRYVKASGGTYPLAQTAFYLAPGMVIGVVSPHTGSGSAATSTAMRSCPPALRSAFGPVVGYADDEPVHLSQGDRFAGIAAYGVAGTGKTGLVNTLFAYDVLDRMAPCGTPGHVGPNLTQVVFESKGSEGIADYWAWLGALGGSAHIVDVFDPNSMSIDLFDVPGTSEERANFFVNAMVASFGEGSIQYASKKTLAIVFAAALDVTEEDFVEAGLPATISVMEAAAVLLTSRGDELGQRLAGALMARVSAMDPDDAAFPELNKTVQRLASMYGPGVSASKRSGIFAAPESKVETLMRNPAWWARSRVRLPWRDIITRHWTVLINTGPTSVSPVTDEEFGSHLSAMLLYSLRHAIYTYCQGWQKANRAIAVYTDELKLLVGDGDGASLVWMRNQGRAYGMWLVMATQYPEQLVPAVRDAVESFGTFFWFSQNRPATIDAAVRDLSSDGSEWSQNDVTTLLPHHAALRTQVNSHRQPAVPIKVGYWADRKDEFPHDQDHDHPRPQ